MNKIKITLSMIAFLFVAVPAFAQSTGVVLYGSPSGYNTGYNYGTNYNYNNGYYNNYTTYDPYNYNYNYNNSNSYYPQVSVSALSYNPYQYYNYNNYSNYYNNQNISLTTTSATNITANTASLLGYVNANQTNYGTSNVSAWFEYGTSATTLNQYTAHTNVYSSTSINANLTNLSCGTTYYYRVGATLNNNSIVQYGTTLSFSTLPCQNNYNNGYTYPYNNQYYYGQNYNQNYTIPYTYGPHCSRTTY